MNESADLEWIREELQWGPTRMFSADMSEVSLQHLRNCTRVKEESAGATDGIEVWAVKESAGATSIDSATVKSNCS
eukprot:CAMPEP_0172739684 /NCGR_PEP_ID=MMETSP1074-20121228/123090_1 /TAXON_ID=2916 /ORGANISM="Ceratium fusus, Strain PA161109" /LENGTH=75 /DNA_ID=CAMNT_0013569615 /DNA_START=291 /DNA_END=515 /DNA_ORIENTATION=+